MSDYRTWQVGDRVVCLTVMPAHPSIIGTLERGREYVIREIGITANGNPGVRVEGLRISSSTGDWGLNNGAVWPCDGDIFVGCFRFRKIHPRSTSKGMSILKDILKGARVPEDAQMQVQRVPVKYDPNYPAFGLISGPVEHKQHPNQRAGLDLYVRVVNFDTGEECFKKLYTNKTGLHFKHTGYSPMYLNDFTDDGEYVPFQVLIEERARRLSHQNPYKTGDA